MEENVTGKFEIHVFVFPFDPAPEIADRFGAACRGAPVPMKALLLKLDYIAKGFVGVLQSSRYVDGDPASARAAAAEDARVLRAAGFEVIREKVEALSTNDGVPRTAEDATRSPADRYFEFHLLIDRKEGPLSNEDVASLRGLSQDFALRFARPVPLSFNALKPSQRFLNLRARGVGLDQAMKPVEELRAAIEGPGELEVKKIISEYICFDSNRAVDDGWLEPVSWPSSSPSSSPSS